MCAHLDSPGWLLAYRFGPTVSEPAFVVKIEEQPMVLHSLSQVDEEGRTVDGWSARGKSLTTQRVGWSVVSVESDGRVGLWSHQCGPEEPLASCTTIVRWAMAILFQSRWMLLILISLILQVCWPSKCFGAIRSFCLVYVCSWLSNMV